MSTAFERALCAASAAAARLATRLFTSLRVSFCGAGEAFGMLEAAIDRVACSARTADVINCLHVVLGDAGPEAAVDDGKRPVSGTSCVVSCSTCAALIGAPSGEDNASLDAGIVLISSGVGDGAGATSILGADGSSRAASGAHSIAGVGSGFSSGSGSGSGSGVGAGAGAWCSTRPSGS